MRLTWRRSDLFFQDANRGNPFLAASLVSDGYQLRLMLLLLRLLLMLKLTLFLSFQALTDRLNGWRLGRDVFVDRTDASFTFRGMG